MKLKMKCHKDNMVLGRDVSIQGTTGGSHLSHTAVKPDSPLSLDFFSQNLVSFFLYNLM